MISVYVDRPSEQLAGPAGAKQDWAGPTGNRLVRQKPLRFHGPALNTTLSRTKTFTAKISALILGRKSWCHQMEIFHSWGERSS